MPVVALVLTRTQPNNTAEVAAKIKDSSNVPFSFITTGRFDIISVVKAESTREAGQTVLNKIRTLNGVTGTETLLVLENKYTNSAALKGNFPVSAFVFGKVSPGTTSTVLESLANLKNLSSIDAVTGEFDISCFVQADSLQSLTQTIYAMRNTAGIQTTETFVCQ